MALAYGLFSAVGMCSNFVIFYVLINEHRHIGAQIEIILIKGDTIHIRMESGRASLTVGQTRLSRGGSVREDRLFVYISYLTIFLI